MLLYSATSGRIAAMLRARRAMLPTIKSGLELFDDMLNVCLDGKLCSSMLLFLIDKNIGLRIEVCRAAH